VINRKNITTGKWLHARPSPIYIIYFINLALYYLPIKINTKLFNKYNLTKINYELLKNPNYTADGVFEMYTYCLKWNLITSLWTAK